MNKYVDAGFSGVFCFPEKDDMISHVLQKEKMWEQSEWNFINQRLSVGQNAINLGAHVGFFTCLMSNIVGEQGHVWSFEPNPEIFECLNDNVSRLAKNNVTTFPYAASNKNEDTKMFVNNRNTGDNRLFDFSLTNDRGYFDKEIDVKAVKVDDLIVDKKIDFILSDCQGWDFFALEGASNIIKRDMPIIVVEIAPVWLEKLGINYEKILKEYESMGYSIGCLQLSHIKSAEDAINNLTGRFGDYNVDLILEKK